MINNTTNPTKLPFQTDYTAPDSDRRFYVLTNRHPAADEVIAACDKHTSEHIAYTDAAHPILAIDLRESPPVPFPVKAGWTL